jgi:hypothetical protein
MDTVVIGDLSELLPEEIKEIVDLGLVTLEVLGREGIQRDRPDPEILRPFKDALGSLRPGPVPLDGTDIVEACIPTVAVLDDGNMGRNMFALPLQVAFIEVLGLFSKDQSGVTSRIIPPFGYRSTTNLRPGNWSRISASIHHAIST